MPLPIKTILNITILQLSTISISSTQKLLRTSDSLKIPIELLSPEQGLSQGMINGIAEDHQGYLWIATKDGLNRYDGAGFRIFRNDPDDPHSLAENFIRSIYVDSRNLVWVGTNSSGLDLFDRSTEQFIHLGKGINPGSSDIKSIHRILEDGTGNIIICDETGLNPEIIYSIKNRRAGEKLTYKITKLDKQFSTVKKISTLFNANNILGFSCDGAMWYHQNGELYKINSRELFQTNNTDENPVLIYKKEHCKIKLQYFFDRTHENLYLLDDNNQILKLDFTTNQFNAIIEFPKQYNINLNNTFVDNQNRIWTSDTKNNILRIDLTSGLIHKMPYLISKEGISFGFLFNNTCEDKQHNLWVGTGGFGLVKISSRTNHFKLLNIPRAEYDEMRRIYTQEKDDLTRKKISSRWLSCKHHLFLEKKGLQFPVGLFGLAVDKQQFFWCPAFNLQKTKHHLIKINPINASVEIKSSEPFENSEWYCSPIFTDNHGEIWFGERASGKSIRLFHFNPESDSLEQFKFPVEVLLTDHPFISDFYISPENKFWLATKQGLFSFEPKTRKWKHFHFNKNDPKSLSSNAIISICLDSEQPENYLWLGTDGGGLNKFNFKTETFERYNTKNALPNDVIYAIQSDCYHNFWISTNNGLCLFNPKTLQTRNFTSKDGLPGNEFNRSDYYKTSDGVLYFGGINGVVVFDPKEFYEDIKPSDIYINKLKLLNKEVSFKQPNTTLSKDDYHLPAPIELCNKLVFEYDQRMITFGFATMDLTNPAANTYKYKMERFNNDWIDGGTNPEATYTNLSPGQYTFKVLGCNSANVWSTTPASIDITILPPWWGTWWFRLCMLLTVVSGIYIFYQYRLQQAMKLQTLRNRIAADLHDEIGSTLSSISLASSVIQKKLDGSTNEVKSLLDRISNNTDNMMEAMSDIVWAVNTRNDRFDNVINRMRAFAVEILEPKNILVHFTISPHVSNLTLNMQQRKNLYLIFKEAINNAAKYSDCENVWLDIEYQNGRMFLNIRDDGKGFEFTRQSDVAPQIQIGNVQNNSFGGNGLHNMERRISELKGKLKIESAAKKGTLVSIEFLV